MPPYIAPEVAAKVGAWGEPSSTLDWCEENYAFNIYVAEFWNTISNAAMVLPSLIGLWTCVTYSLEMRYFLCYLWLGVVGVGSVLFHGTLLYTMQLLDELPMLILSAVMLFSLYEMGQKRGTKTQSTYIKALLLIAYTTVVSFVYIIINDPTFHEIAYAIMVLGLVGHGFYSVRRHSRHEQILPLALFSFGLYLFGFILWNIDNHFCPHLRDYRSSAPSFGAFTQLHAWWHFFAGMGTYLHLVVSSRVRMEFLKHPCSIKYIFGFPYLQVSSPKT